MKLRPDLLAKVMDAQGADAAQRLEAEQAAKRMVRATYEAAQPSRLRKFSRNKASGDTLAKAYAGPLRDQARHLERNHDLARGILRKLVNNTVGPNGVSVEPQPRRLIDGSIHEDLAKILTDLYRDWSKRPEVTGAYSNAQMQRMVASAWFRDGEMFGQKLLGPIPGLKMRRVPFAIELLEAEMVPSDYHENDFGAGIKLNAWGQPVAYKVHKVHPGDNLMWQQRADLKTIGAESMLHIARCDRHGQRRGVSEFASVITRMEDLKDYEESERIAAKIAASMAAYIKKGQPDLYEEAKDENGEVIRRELRFQPGMVFDDLAPGEEIGMIDTNRPNTNLQAHRDGQLRAVSAGAGVSYSSASRNYNGTYSAQRQELVEQYVDYQVLTDEFVAQWVQPVYEFFVAAALSAGLIPRAMLREIEPDSLDDALYIGQQMPWIDPVKEADAFILLEEHNYISGPEIIRRRGGNPTSVLDQQAKWKQQLRDRGLDTPPKPAAPPAPAQPKQQEQQDDQAQDA